jgi:hypothetical protein
MKKLLMCFLFVPNLGFGQSDAPALPPNACYEKCNSFMQDLLSEFEVSGVAPTQDPSVYSGVCHHAGIYDPDVEHFGVVLLDIVNGAQKFGGRFSFFTGQNDYADWDIQKARSEISPDWERYGKTILEQNTLRCEIRQDDGAFAYVYWMRQNPVTKELLLIYFAPPYQRSFCRMKQHPS